MAGHCAAFTLIELIVVVAIVLVLAALGAQVLQNVRKSGDQAAAVSQYRQIGVGVIQYAGDHNGSLPGPLKPGQGAVYNPEKTDQLATHVGPYLGITDLTQPSLVKVFVSPAYAKENPAQDLMSAIVFVMNISAKGEDEGIRPWGSDVDPVEDPKKLAAVPVTNWAFSDADRLHPQAKSAPWANRSPPKVIHGDMRLAFFFDGTVKRAPEEILKPAPGGPGKPGGPPPPPPPPPPPKPPGPPPPP